MGDRVETARLWSRPWDEATDVPLWHALATDVGYNAFAPPGAFLVADDDGARAWIRRRSAHPGLGKWPVFRRSDGGFVGTCGLDPYEIRGAPSVELGYRLLLAHWGCGYATEIAAAVLARGIARFGVVHAFAAPQNRASLAVLRRLGMRPDGGLVHGGVPHDLFVAP